MTSNNISELLRTSESVIVLDVSCGMFSTVLRIELTNKPSVIEGVMPENVRCASEPRDERAMEACAARACIPTALTARLLAIIVLVGCLLQLVCLLGSYCLHLPSALPISSA
jgi:hypothetical protein